MGPRKRLVDFGASNSSKSPRVKEHAKHDIENPCVVAGMVLDSGILGSVGRVWRSFVLMLLCGCPCPSHRFFAVPFRFASQVQSDPNPLEFQERSGCNTDPNFRVTHPYHKPPPHQIPPLSEAPRGSLSGLSACVDVPAHALAMREHSFPCLFAVLGTTTIVA